MGDSGAVHATSHDANEIASGVRCHSYPWQPLAFERLRFYPLAGARYVYGSAAGRAGGAGGCRAGLIRPAMLRSVPSSSSPGDRNRVHFHVAGAFWRLGNYEACAVSACSRGRRDGASGVQGRAGHVSEAWLRVRTAVRTKMVRVCAYAESANLLCIGVTSGMPVIPVSCGYAEKNHVSSIQ
jgi:hypothetical protein